MENYNILESLGEGAQGFSYLVESVLNKEKYILKQVECKDENEANKAFREATYLTKLKHPYICPYKDMFVYWDEKNSSIHLCIVLEYYPNGSLKNILKKYRNEKKFIPERIAKRWLGQILDAFVYIHQHGIIHRDLKPNNILIDNKENLVISDFSVTTIISDVRKKARVPNGTTTWMAPEIVKKAYDEKTDIWSIGCVVLEMLTCNFTSNQEIQGKLYEIKYNSSVLIELMDFISENYSSDMIDLIKSMLHIDYDQRPTTTDLLKEPYVKECLLFSGSTFDSQNVTTEEDFSNELLPKGQGFEPVIEFLSLHAGKENNARVAMIYLSELTSEKNLNVEIYPTIWKELIIKAIKLHPSNFQVQIYGFKTILNMIISSNLEDILYAKDTISLVLNSMKNHSANIELQIITMQLFSIFAIDDDSSKYIGDMKGIQKILKAMDNFSNDPNLIAKACEAIWNLTVNEDNCRNCTELKGIKYIIQALIEHGNNAIVVENASAALLSLSLEDENHKCISESDCIGILTNSLVVHGRNAKVCKNVCMTLASLVETDEESAYHLLSNDRNGPEIRGLPIITTVYEKHKDNALVVESLCILLLELSKYDEICAEMKHLKIGESILYEVHKRFKDNSDIMKPCENILAKLFDGKIRVAFACD